MLTYFYKIFSWNIYNKIKNRYIYTKKKSNLISGQHHYNKGRNARGIITLRHRGGGYKHLYRKIDFLYKYNNNKKIITREYDPNRNAYICLIYYKDGKKKYILYIKGILLKDIIFFDTKIPIKIGNTLSLTNIPIGINIHNIEITYKKGGQLVKAAGTIAKLITKDKKKVTLKLPSGKTRLINKNCLATIGQIDNYKKKNTSEKKAGFKRRIGKRPIVRGKAMNSVDHPHGGGKGKTPIGKKKPATPWGYPIFRKKKNNKNKIK
nr:ribosomal protein L2 [Sarcophyte sanguinea]